MSSGHNNRSQRIPLIVASEPDNVGVTLGTGPIERRLAAFLALDIKDYAAMISRDEAGAHRRVGRDLVIVVRQIHKQAGRILQFTGDGLLAEFSSATATLKAGLSIQASSRSSNRRRSADDRIEYRIGINSGDFVVQSGRVGGDTINIAARLEQIAEPGGICISEVVHAQVNRTVSATYTNIGAPRLKNIRYPVSTYRVTPGAGKGRTSVSPSLIGPAESQDYRPSIAILPLENLNAGSDSDY